LNFQENTKIEQNLGQSEKVSLINRFRLNINFEEAAKKILFFISMLVIIIILISSGAIALKHL
jgi:hypothetical protein